MKLTKIKFKMPYNKYGERRGAATVTETTGYHVNYKGIDFVIHKRLDNDKIWTISEYTTGMKVWGAFKLRKDAVAMLDFVIRKYGERIPKAVARVPKINEVITSD